MNDIDTTETETPEVTAQDKAQALIQGASLMPGTDGAAMIVPTEALAEVHDRVATLTKKVSENATMTYDLRRQVDGFDERITDALKAAVSEGTIDMDTAKSLAENNFDVDPDALTTTYEVLVTVTVRVTGVKAEDEDEARNAVSEAISVDLHSYSGLDYDSVDQEDVSVDEVTEES